MDFSAKKSKNWIYIILNAIANVSRLDDITHRASANYVLDRLALFNVSSALPILDAKTNLPRV